MNIGCTHSQASDERMTPGCWSFKLLVVTSIYIKRVCYDVILQASQIAINILPAADSPLPLRSTVYLIINQVIPYIHQMLIYKQETQQIVIILAFGQLEQEQIEDLQEVACSC